MSIDAAELVSDVVLDDVSESSAPPPSEPEQQAPGLQSTTEEAPGSLVLTHVHFQRFKQFRKADVAIEPGMTLVAGANNAGKSTILHGLAVWEFCRTATLMERGLEGLFEDATTKQGFGLGDDEFSPINVPSLKHLWTNLKTAKTDDDADGYTLQITCNWTAGEATKTLGFALSLSNDRLFIKTAVSNLAKSDKPPVFAYLPPFAGIRAREERVGGAIRRRRIGEGLAGAILRNLLLDMQQRNLERRAELKGSKHKMADSDLRRLRETDPWELLQDTLRQVFSIELKVDDFEEEYHSYIKVEIVKGSVDGYKLTRYPNYNPRDLMVEGSGFLQWLSVYALAVAPEVDVLMFDEPDAHLHPSLQRQLTENLSALADRTRKQVLIATHSTEILRAAQPARIMHITGQKARYLSAEHQKVGMMAGLGSDYAPKFDRVRATRSVFFVEGSSDLKLLHLFAAKLGRPWPERWVEWHTSASHKERKLLHRAMVEEFGAVCAYSLRDRDDEALGTVGAGLVDKSLAVPDPLAFAARKWRRRHIESYLIWPPAIAAAAGTSEEAVRLTLQEDHAIAIGASFTDLDAPPSLLDLRGKELLANFNVSPMDVAKEMEPSAICEDIILVIDELVSFGAEPPG